MASHQPGQTSFTFKMIAVKREMSQVAERLKERTPDQIGKTERNRRVLHNALVIAGTRIPTSAIWAYHENGYSTGEIIQAYPRSTPRDIEVAIAQESARHQQHVG